MPPIPPQERPEQRRGQQLLFVTVLFAVLLNFPFLAVFDHDGRVGGIPVLYLYVLLVWVLLVLLTGWLVRR
ncbi:hypothetical protein MUN84_21785 [Hymenobacter sp. 5516J-16]|uniref:DUF3311 domain-containing protein n=1 Tax=Hymenobacter sublimis TaxID=2933777 RepID=A0ABY4JG20_9BACT|nr:MULTISPECIES: hypothetical protein [Hymenobacter]UOQ77055.1 hypothetical protein MUN84_21785 [Hymenobacter sp. 5516J-16]UPL50747.1 hypothetical protein MWH26_07545 [Hymenobacter sublimis]